MRRAAAVALVVAGLGVWIALAPRMHAHHHGDSLVPVLESLYTWQPYLWEYDRFGMLVPLLALPFRSAMTNLLVQTALTSAAGLALFFVLARVAAGRRSDAAVVAGALAAALFVAFGTDAQRAGLLGTAQSYGTALALGGAGLALGGAGLVAATGEGALRRAAGAALLGLALWVNIGLVFALGPLALVRALLARRRADVTAALATLGAAFAANLLLARTVAEVRQTYAVLPIREWPACWAGLLANGWHQLLSPGSRAALAALLLVGTAAHVAARGRGVLRPALEGAAALLAGGAASLLVIGTINWTKFQDFAARYAQPTALLAMVAIAFFASVPLLALLPERARRAAPAAAVAALALAVAFAFGPPSPAGVRAALDRSAGIRTADVIASGATHIMGSYWNVWPAVFHANLVLAERGGDRRVWGVTHRSGPTAKFWARIPLRQWRVAIVPGDDEVAGYLGHYRLPTMVEVERRATITVVAPLPTRESSP